MHEKSLTCRSFRYDSVGAGKARRLAEALPRTTAATNRPAPFCSTHVYRYGDQSETDREDCNQARCQEGRGNQGSREGSREGCCCCQEAAPAAAAPTPRPLKDTFNKSSTVAHTVAQTQLEAKAVKSVLAHLENTIVSALHKKGAGEFTLPGLLKVTAQQVPAKKKRFGKDPFTGESAGSRPSRPASRSRSAR